LQAANQTVRRFLLTVALSCLGGFIHVAPVLAQADDSYSECARLLSSPPFDTLLFEDNGHRYGELNSDHLGETLLGVKCSRDQIVDYFVSAGWELKGEKHRYGVAGPSSARYESDFNIGFCKPKKLPWRLIFYRCAATSGFHLFKGRITHINAGARI
jgi:hypothetical protein